MPLAAALAQFQGDVTQCESLIVNAHRADATGAPLFTPIDRQQITVAAFLNMFIAWEGFLEAALANLMVGAPTIGGVFPTKYVSPVDAVAARSMVIGTGRYFDYANHEYVKKIVRLFFDAGYPFEPHISGIEGDLVDLKAMRNASAHISSSTRIQLDALALRIFSAPSPGMDLYSLLTALDPRSTTGETVFQTYRNRLLVAAELIAGG